MVFAFGIKEGALGIAKYFDSPCHIYSVGVGDIKRFAGHEGVLSCAVLTARQSPARSTKIYCCDTQLGGSRTYKPFDPSGLPRTTAATSILGQRLNLLAE